MSLILDALKRAERDHPRDLSQRVGSSDAWARPRRRPRGGWVATIVLVAAVSVAAAGWLHWQARTEAPGPGLEHGAAVRTPEPASAEPARIAPERSVLDDIRLEPVIVEADTGRSAAARPDAPFLEQLPEETRAGLPAFQVNAHVWSDDPGRRMIMINMRNLREGDTVAEGLRLTRILPDGAEFEWRGERFRISAR